MKSKVRYLLPSIAVFSLVCTYFLSQTQVKTQGQRPDVSTIAVEKQSDRQNYEPEDGFVPDKQTATAIAVAVWIPIYGKEKIERQKPYRTSLKDDVWTVSGTLPVGLKGGTAIAEISKKDGRILRVIHGK